jgi:hypothetical protein
LAEPVDLPQVWELAHSLLGSRIASLNELCKVHTRNRAGIFVLKADHGPHGTRSKPELSGFLALLYLSPAGEAAVLRGDFTPDSIRPDWLVGASEVPVAFYGWAIAARGPQARREVVLLARRFSLVVLPHLRQYSHAVTPAGERLLRMLGYSELRQDSFVEPVAERIFHRAPNR